MEYPFEVYANTPEGFDYAPIEGHAIEAGKTTLVKAGMEDSMRSVLMDQMRHMLPFVSEAYDISQDIKDYVMVPVVIMPSDLPNRNMQAFPLRELTKFNHDIGKLGYQSWQWQPTHVSHQNHNPMAAKGVVFDSVLKKMPGYHGNLHKVVCLLGFDRRKDSILANDILNRVKTAYSMGALSKRWTCSICGKERHENCGHVKASPTIYDGVLAYWQIRDFKGFEVSNVGGPGSGAYDSAQNSEFMQL